MALTELGDLVGGQLAVLAGDSEHLVTCGLYRSGLMDVDVAGLRGNYALMRAQRCADHGEIGLRAAHQEVDAGLRRPAGLPDEFPGLAAELILPIAHGLCQIGGAELFQNPGMRSLGVIAVKVDHSHRFLSMDQIAGHEAILSQSGGKVNSGKTGNFPPIFWARGRMYHILRCICIFSPVPC